jgi:hypothetical protein
MSSISDKDIAKFKNSDNFARGVNGDTVMMDGKYHVVMLDSNGKPIPYTYPAYTKDKDKLVEKYVYFVNRFGTNYLYRPLHKRNTHRKDFVISTVSAMSGNKYDLYTPLTLVKTIHPDNDSKGVYLYKVPDDFSPSKRKPWNDRFTSLFKRRPKEPLIILGGKRRKSRRNKRRSRKTRKH